MVRFTAQKDILRYLTTNMDVILLITRPCYNLAHVFSILYTFLDKIFKNNFLNRKLCFVYELLKIVNQNSLYIFHKSNV
jgi:hypothetical protein